MEWHAQIPSLACRQRSSRAMSKPDPYGDRVLFPAGEDAGKNQSASDDELIVAAREVWPRALVHAEKELNANGLSSDSASMAAPVWEQMLRSVSKTRRRNTDHPQAIADLQSYLFLAFVHRFNRAVQQEQKHAERIELVSSSVDLEHIQSAQDIGWVKPKNSAAFAGSCLPWLLAVNSRRYGYAVTCEKWKERSVPMRQREEVQELLLGGAGRPV